MSRLWISAGILSLGVLGAPNVRAASDVLPGSTSATVSYTFGNYTVAISGCNETASGTTVTGDCANEQVLGTVTGNGSLVLTYESLAGSSLLNTTAGTGQNKDMSFNETVSTTGKLINAVAVGLTGTLGSPLNGFEQQDVKTSMVDPAVGMNINTNMANGSSPYTVAQSISPTNSLTISKDLSASNNGPSGDSIALNTVTQTFNVPEPASLSLLAIGFGGLLGLRRKRRRAAV